VDKRFLELEVAFGEGSHQVLVDVQQIQKTVMTDKGHLGLPDFLEQQPISELLIFQLYQVLLLLLLAYLLHPAAILRRVERKGVGFVFFEHTVEQVLNGSKQHLVAIQCELELCSLWVRNKFATGIQKFIGTALILSGLAVQDPLGRAILLLLLENRHFGDFNVIDALANPFVPVHPVLIVKLDAVKLHAEVSVKAHRVAGEKVEVEGVCLQNLLLWICHYKCQS